MNYSYYNNRIVGEAWQYDADGRTLVANDTSEYVFSTFDARGLLTKQTSNYNREVNRYYDGNGREARRGGRDYNDSQNQWIERNPIYYIRSSVLGNEVVSEAEVTGRKLKTFVKAAGATLAWQTSYYNSTNQTETGYVNFEHLDVSAMSYRSTLSDGTPITNEGGEGSPAELDPLGGNVGLYTPYIQLTAPPFEPEYPTLQPMNEDMPMIVNGQRVTCSLDGMAIGCTQAQSMLNTGSALPAALAPFQHLPGFQFSSSGLGLFTVQILRQVGWHVNPDQSVSRIYSGNSFDTFVVDFGSWNISRNSQQQTRQDSGIDYSKILNEAIKGVKKRLKDRPECAKLLDKFNPENFVANFVYISEERPTGVSFSGEGEAAFTLSDVDSKGKRLASGQVAFNQNSFFFTEKYKGQKFSDFFTDKVRENLGIGNLSINKLRELILIHELVHINDTEGKFNDLGTPNKPLNQLIKEKCFD